MKRVGAGVFVLVAVVAAMVMLAACGDGDDSGGGNGSAKPKVYEAGDSINVERGDTFVIALEANPTTGYSWEAEPNADVEFVTSKYVAGNPNLVGAPGTQQLTFEAVQKGESTLVLNYLRPFESGVPPVETEEFDVTIT